MENKTMRNKEWFEKCVRESKSISEALIRMGYNTPSNFYRMFYKYINLYKTSIIHFENTIQTRSKWNDEEVFVEDFKGSLNGNQLKKRLYKANLKQPICELCGQDENWVTGKISMIIDHINGNNKDNRLENLRIICPNCDAALPTYKAKNIRSPKKEYSLDSYENHIIEEYKKIIKDFINEGYGWKQKSINKLQWSRWKFNEFLKKYFNKEELNQFSGNNKENIIKYNKIIEDNIELINFNKRGWSIRLGKLLNKDGQYSHKFIKTYYPEIYKICYKHKS